MWGRPRSGWQHELTFENPFFSRRSRVHDAPIGSGSSASRLRAAEPAFGCELSQVGRGAAWVRVTGELDRTTAPQLTQILGQAGRARIVVVDLRGLTRVDSTGVGAIVDASRSARRHGRRLVLVRGLTRVDRLLALIGALDAVETVDLAAGEPPSLALLQLATKDRADARRPPPAPRRVSLVLEPAQLTRGVDEVIAGNTTSSTQRKAAPTTASTTHKEDASALEQAPS